ncbi:MAG: hypothetical protein Kow0090_10040 [Myxococcota bacterium]
MGYVATPKEKKELAPVYLQLKANIAKRLNDIVIDRNVRALERRGLVEGVDYEVIVNGAGERNIYIIEKDNQ